MAIKHPSCAKQNAHHEQPAKTLLLKTLATYEYNFVLVIQGIHADSQLILGAVKPAKEHYVSNYAVMSREVHSFATAAQCMPDDVITDDVITDDVITDLVDGMFFVGVRHDHTVVLCTLVG